MGRAQIQPTVKFSGAIVGSLSEAFSSRCRLDGGIICESGTMESAVELVLPGVVGTDKAVKVALGSGLKVQSGKGDGF